MAAKDWSQVEIEIYRKANRDLWLKNYDLEDDNAVLRDEISKWQEKARKLETAVKKKDEEIATLKGLLTRERQVDDKFEKIKKRCETFGEVLRAQEEPKADEGGAAVSLREMKYEEQQLPAQLGRLSLSTPSEDGSVVGGCVGSVPGQSPVAPSVGSSSNLDEVETLACDDDEEGDSSATDYSSPPRGRPKKNFPCFICKQEFVGGQELHDHVRLNHFQGLDATRRNACRYGWCNMCGQSFSVLKEVEAHRTAPCVPQ